MPVVAVGDPSVEGEVLDACQIQFKRLQKYKDKHGDCNVKQRGTGKLGNWVKTQRAFFKKGKLSSDNIQSLEGIGFNWRVQHDDN